MLPYKNIESVERIETPLSTEMSNALETWYNMYMEQADWLQPGTVESLNLPAMICSEIARQITLEMKWNITGKKQDGQDEPVENARSKYLKAEFEKLLGVLRQKLEQGCAAGGMVIKPYPKNSHIHFDWTMAWSMYPIAFGDDGELTDVIFPSQYTEGKTVYTRLERHTLDGDTVHITQRAFKSNDKNVIGIEIPLTDVPLWESLAPEADVKAADGMMFGFFKVASANNVDVDSPMGVSVFSKATQQIRQADEQYSRLLWEFEGSELAIDVDPTVLRPRKDQDGLSMPRLKERLFRATDLGQDDSYHIFSPTIRDASIINGMNQILMKVEDLCGLARGTLSDSNVEARTATELRIVKQRSYATIADNQAALERCLRDVIHAMDTYATLYDLAEDGEYDVSFEWDDSIITDSEQQMNERLTLLSNQVISKAEIRQWYFGETESQAKAAIEAITAEQAEQMVNMQALLPSVGPDDTSNPAAG